MKHRRFTFRACRPRMWDGRYGRVPGNGSVVHVRARAGARWPAVDWERGGETGQCWMVDDGDVADLVSAVKAGKRLLGAGPGGAFSVNEFGQVLVPANDGERTRVTLVGECAGRFAFGDPFQPGRVVDLADDSACGLGDAWERPYVGIPHNLSKRDDIYFKQVHESGVAYLNPPVEDPALVADLRKVRPYGAVRFLVGVGGIVITKAPPAWEPRYVGRIDPARWFPKEG